MDVVESIGVLKSRLFLKDTVAPSPSYWPSDGNYWVEFHGPCYERSEIR